MTSTISTRLDDASAALLDKLALAQGRSRDAIVAETLTAGLRLKAQFWASIQEAIDELDAGLGIPNDQVMAMLDEMIAKHQARCAD